LAMEYHQQRRFAEALRLADRAAELYRQRNRQRQPAYALLLANVALIHRDAGNHGAAVPLAAQAVELHLRYLRDTDGLLSGRQRLQARGQLSAPLPLLLDLGRHCVPVALLCEKALAFKGLLAAEQHRLRGVVQNATTTPLLEKLHDTRVRLAELSTQAP